MKKALLVAGLTMALACASGTAWACSGGDCGGPTLEWEQPYYLPGETAAATGTHLWAPGDRDAPRPGTCYLYLRPRANIRRPADRDPLAIRVGVLAVDRKNQGATATFIVPQVEGGLYYLSICDEDCERAFGNIYSLPIRILGSTLEERRYLSDRYEDLRTQVFRQSSKAARQDWKLRKEIRKNDVHHEWTRDQLVDQVVALEERVARIKARLEGTKPPDQRLSLVTAGGASLLAGLALRRRRKDPVSS